MRQFANITTFSLLAVACDQRATPAPGETAQEPASLRGATVSAAPAVGSPPGSNPALLEGCNEVPSSAELGQLLKAAPDAPDAGDAGGLASGRFSWAAIVNRSGELCAVAVSTDDRAAPWPGSQAIAKAKAYTANAYSTDKEPLSTARLYTMTQPGHSLWGLAQGNPFHPECLTSPSSPNIERRLCGGTITFGGGLPLYRAGKRIGGLGVSGDTACADHEIAKRIRHTAKLDPAGGRGADDIQFTSVDGPSVFAHPLCANTYRDGKKLGSEAPAQGY